MTDLAFGHADRIHSVITARRPGMLGVDARIAQSWSRCVHDHGLDPARQPEPEILAGRALHERQESLAGLLAIARLEMTTLHQQLAGSGHGILLTDAGGVVLHFEGEPGFKEAARATGMCVGAVWSEDRQGTNAMGTCLVERQPLVIHHTDHFFARNTRLTCSAAPVFDPAGNLIAVLDASSQAELAQQHTLVLVNMAAQTIENRLLLDRHAGDWILRFHSRPEFVGALGEGLIAFDAAGVARAANRSALFQLGLEGGALAGRRLETLFNVGADFLHAARAQSWIAPTPVFDARRGSRFFAFAQQPRGRETFAPAIEAPSAVPMAAAPADLHDMQLADLQTGDAVIDRIVRSASRLRGRDLPVMIQGETGTGKEVLARALHNSIVGAGRPFVAVNCAAVPEALIESELFGYKGGAFSGASRDGQRGKIQQADGGTLFLDEIGDMPLPMQARLLRVLEEREVLPLGASTPVRVDLRVVCATHRDLDAMARRGEFREDLFYRLQGVTLKLPALRERSDRRAMIQRLLEREAANETVRMDEELLALLERLPWPGNLRQLRNTLRAMVALRESDRLTVRDLPPGLAPAPAAAPAAPLADAARATLLHALEDSYWNISRAAGRLGISRNTLYRKMRQLGIQDPSRRPAGGTH